MSKSELIVPQNLERSPPETVSLLSVIERAARDPNIDVEKMERLFALQERFQAKQAEVAFNGALNAGHSKIHAVAAKNWNSQTKSHYADYTAYDRMVRPVYLACGFSQSFDTTDSPLPDHIRVLCHLSHVGGHTRVYHVDMPADGKGAKGGDVMTKTHAAGAAMTYGMRYLVKMIWNIAIGEDDNDGNTDEEYITAEQIADLEALIDEVKANKVFFLKACKVESLADIKKQHYDQYVKILREKGRQ